MSSLKLTIAMKNVAFDQCPQLEVARILRDYALWVEGNDHFEATLRDSNGNAVGHATLSVRLWASKLMNFLNCGGVRTYEDRTTTYWMLRNKQFGKQGDDNRSSETFKHRNDIYEIPSWPGTVEL
jgi:hypothetical protein